MMNDDSKVVSPPAPATTADVLAAIGADITKLATVCGFVVFLTVLVGIVMAILSYPGGITSLLVISPETRFQRETVENMSALIGVAIPWLIASACMIIGLKWTIRVITITRMSDDPIYLKVAFYTAGIILLLEATIVFASFIRYL